MVAASLQCVYGLTPLLLSVDMFLSWMTAGAKTRQVSRARGIGAKYVMHHYLALLCECLADTL